MKKTGCTHIITVILFALVPLIAALVACAVNGMSFGEIYLPASQWNDELIYYKIVGGVVNYGYPQGFFGFNESHAAILSFAAWSPVLIGHYALYGLIFGWNYLSPIICNVLFMCISFAVFALVSKTEDKKLWATGLLFIAFQPAVRYMLSGMSEAFFFFMTVLVSALILRLYHGDKKTSTKLILTLLIVVLSASRPFFIPLLFISGYFIFRDNKKAACIITPTALLVTAAMYWFVNKYLSAPYFTPVVHDDIFSAFSDGGIIKGVIYFLSCLKNDTVEFLILLKNSVAAPDIVGVCYLSYCLIAVFIIAIIIKAIKEKNKVKIIFTSLYFIWYIAVIPAIMLFSDFPVGSRHIITYVVAGLFFAPEFADKKLFKITCYALSAAVLIFSSAVMFKDPYYDLPQKTADKEAKIISAEEMFKEELIINDKGLSWDNTIVWMYSDDIDNAVVTDFTYLFAVPDGLGVNLVLRSSFGDNITLLLSKYIYVYPGGELAELITEAGGKLLVRSDEYEVYLNPRYAN